ncbi:hypothetical protein EMCRGX_G013051 [Ephydatia muelleri]
MDSDRGDETSTGALEKLATKLNQFLVEIRNVTVGQYTAQLCNLESSVACSICSQRCGLCYLRSGGRTHNYWHGAAMLMEEKAHYEGELSNGLPRSRVPPSYDGNYADDLHDPLKEETLDSLLELYASMNEEEDCGWRDAGSRRQP